MRQSVEAKDRQPEGLRRSAKISVAFRSAKADLSGKLFVQFLASSHANGLDNRVRFSRIGPMPTLALIRAGLAALVGSAILAGCVAAPIWSGQVGSRRENTAASEPKHADEFDPKTACDEVVKAHNRIRAEAKRPALAVSSKLRAAAERHAKDMAAHKVMAHKGSDGTSPIDRINSAGYHYRRAGENIAAGRFAIDRLMKGWMNSPPHKRNILGSFSQIGVAYATAEDGKRYWCVTFGLPARR
jgi:hypothetical protein